MKKQKVILKIHSNKKVSKKVSSLIFKTTKSKYNANLSDAITPKNKKLKNKSKKNNNTQALINEQNNKENIKTNKKNWLASLFKKINKNKEKDTEEKVEELSIPTTPLEYKSQVPEGQTMYFDPKTSKPVYGQPPAYYDSVTGKPVFNTPVGFVSNKKNEPRKQPITYSLAATITIIAGILIFLICTLVIYFSTLSEGSSDGTFWALLILTWLFGPLILLIVPPICCFVGFVLTIVNTFVGYNRVYTWVSMPINFGMIVFAILLMVNYI